MVLSYYSPSTKALLIGFCSAFAAFAIVGVILFNAETLPQCPATVGMVTATVLAWVGVAFLHKATFGRQY